LVKISSWVASCELTMGKGVELARADQLRTWAFDGTVTRSGWATELLPSTSSGETQPVGLAGSSMALCERVRRP
jgi:hypothetical protein